MKSTEAREFTTSFHSLFFFVTIALVCEMMILGPTKIELDATEVMKFLEPVSE